MDRTHDIVILPGTAWLNDPAAQAVCAAIEAGGHRIYFVGGCVRNALMGLPDSDVDMCTDARPDRVMALAQDAGLKAIPTGMDHGTITVVAEGEPFEITTFRRDVETDGRRAVVAYTDDLTEDARRRDFTMNALYATAQGQVIDPLGGVEDLRARRVRFIDDPAARIREDYLRILRFFRFSAAFVPAEQGFDPDALAAIAANTGGLETLSAERVGQEMTKLLSAPDPAPALAVMRQTGVLHPLLPGADDRWIAPLVHLEAQTGVPSDWRSRLALLGGDDPALRLRLSKADARRVALLQEQAFAGPPLAELAHRQGAEIATQVVLMRAALSGQEVETAALETVRAAAAAVFPVQARDLMPDYQGAALGARLAELRQAWIDSGFALDRAALLARD